MEPFSEGFTEEVPSSDLIHLARQRRKLAREREETISLKEEPAK